MNTEKQQSIVEQLLNNGGKIVMSSGASGRIIVETPDGNWHKINPRGGVTVEPPDDSASD